MRVRLVTYRQIVRLALEVVHNYANFQDQWAALSAIRVSLGTGWDSEVVMLGFCLDVLGILEVDFYLHDFLFAQPFPSDLHFIEHPLYKWTASIIATDTTALRSSMIGGSLLFNIPSAGRESSIQRANVERDLTTDEISDITRFRSY
jgi:hypothetical protein